MHILREEVRKILISKSSGKQLTPGIERKKKCKYKMSIHCKLAVLTALRRGFPICDMAGVRTYLLPGYRGGSPTTDKGEETLADCRQQMQGSSSLRQGRLLSLEERSVWMYLSPDPHMAIFPQLVPAAF